MAERHKEYRASIWAKLTDELLPSPCCQRSNLTAMLKDALKAGDDDSPLVGVAVEDPIR